MWPRLVWHLLFIRHPQSTFHQKSHLNIISTSFIFYIFFFLPVSDRASICLSEWMLETIVQHSPARAFSLRSYCKKKKKIPITSNNSASSARSWLSFQELWTISGFMNLKWTPKNCFILHAQPSLWFSSCRKPFRGSFSAARARFSLGCDHEKQYFR